MGIPFDSKKHYPSSADKENENIENICNDGLKAKSVQLGQFGFKSISSLYAQNPPAVRVKFPKTKSGSICMPSRLPRADES